MAGGGELSRSRPHGESGIPDAESETGLALAKFHLGQLSEPGREGGLARPTAAALASSARTSPARHRRPRSAQPHALAAYKWAWADGEPYVNRYELTKTTELLNQMNVPVPNSLSTTPSRDEKLPWEDAVRAAIVKLRAETRPRRMPAVQPKVRLKRLPCDKLRCNSSTTKRLLRIVFCCAATAQLPDGNQLRLHAHDRLASGKEGSGRRLYMRRSSPAAKSASSRSPRTLIWLSKD